MKNILYFIIFLYTLSSSVIAQDVPRVISYQGVLVDANGKPETRKNVSFAFTFYSDKTLDNIVVQKQSKVLDVIGGLFNTMLEIPPTADLNQQLWLEIEVEGKIFPNRIQMATALYALNIPDNVVTEKKIVDGAVTSNKIATNAITNQLIKDKSITAEKINSSSVMISLNGLKDDVTIQGESGIKINSSNKDKTIKILPPQGYDSKHFLRWNTNTEQWEPSKFTLGNEFIGEGTEDNPFRLTYGNSVGQVLKWDGENWYAGTDETESGVNSGLKAVNVIPPLSGDGTATAPILLRNGARDKQVLQWNSKSNLWSIQDLSFDSLSRVVFWRLETNTDINRPNYRHTYIGGYQRSSFLGGAIITFDAQGRHIDSLNFNSSKAGMLGEGIVFSKELYIADSSIGNKKAGINGEGKVYAKEIFIVDNELNAKAGLRLDAQGKAEIWSSGTKPFVVTDPTYSNRQIKYTAIEGPEAAMYYRGKGRLANGKAIINLPEHFTALVVDTSLTFSLTPHSSMSLGLSISNYSSKFFEVVELNQGLGNYEFSFVIYGIRKGYENYEVYIHNEQFPNIQTTIRDNHQILQKTNYNIK